MHRQQTLRAVVRNQQGGIGFHVLWVIFIILLLIPFFWDVSSVFYARGSARTAADAATLAAAQEYAHRLQRTTAHNGIFRGKCSRHEYTPQQVVLRYLREPALTASPAIGLSAATSYASANRNELIAYRSWPEYSGTVYPAGIPVPVIKVYGETQRPVHMAYRPLYGRDFDMTNRAVAVAYLKHWRMVPRPCPGSTRVPRVTYDLTFEWSITLDAATAQRL
jgi:Flp pilus assembly protein TadG